MLGKKIGIDLGSAAMRVHLRGEGVVLDEPAAVAVAAEGRVIAVGSAAYEAAARGEGHLRHPLRAGAIDDRAALDACLAHLVSRGAGRQRIFKPDVMVAVASAMSGADRRATLEGCARAGARSMYLIDAPLAAAVGSAVSTSGASGRLIVDIGAGKIDCAVVAGEGMVAVRCLRRGAAQLTADIAAHLSLAYGARVDDSAAEEAKREVGSAVPLAEERTLRLPAWHGSEEVEVVVSSTEVHAAMAGWLRSLAELVDAVVDEAPEPLADDVRHRTGGLLAGAGSRLRGLDRYLGVATRIPMTIAPDPAGCVVRGTGAALESLDVVRRTFLYVR